MPPNKGPGAFGVPFPRRGGTTGWLGQQRGSGPWPCARFAKRPPRLSWESRPNPGAWALCVGPGHTQGARATTSQRAPRTLFGGETQEFWRPHNFWDPFTSATRPRGANNTLVEDQFGATTATGVISHYPKKGAELDTPGAQQPTMGFREYCLAQTKAAPRERGPTTFSSAGGTRQSRPKLANTRQREVRVSENILSGGAFTNTGGDLRAPNAFTFTRAPGDRVSHP